METIAGIQSENIFKFSEPLPVKIGTPDIKSFEQNKEVVYTFSLPLDIFPLKSTSGFRSNDNFSTGFGKKFKRDHNEWECQVCMISNKFEKDKCVACETPRKPMISSSSSGNNILKSDNWKCPTCMISNKSASDACIACETKKPLTNADDGFKILAAQQKAFKWECSACMTQNSYNNKKCICCDQQMSACTKVESKQVLSGAQKFTFGFGDGVNAPTETELRKSSSAENAKTLKTEVCQKEGYTFGYWKCNSCQTSNKNEENSCLVCQSKKSEPKFQFGFASPKTTTTGDAGFKALASQQKASKWECSACMTQNDMTNTSCICCEQTKLCTVTESKTVDNTKFSFGFGFGVAKKEELKKYVDSEATRINNTSSRENDKEQEKLSKFGFTSNKTADAGFKTLAAQQKLSKWECNTCLTQNNDNLLKCACCEQVKPNETLKKDSNKLNQIESVAGKFRFGFGNGVSAPTEEDLKKEMQTEASTVVDKTSNKS